MRVYKCPRMPCLMGFRVGIHEILSGSFFVSDEFYRFYFFICFGFNFSLICLFHL